VRKISVILILLVFACYGNAYKVDGSFETAFSSESNDSENTIKSENYFNLNNLNIYGNLFKFNFSGKYTYADKEEDSESLTEIYESYMSYSTFENKFSLKAGRFTNFTNRFMTIDGLNLEYNTNDYFGFEVFGGIPKFLFREDRYIDKQFRDTGDRIYGGKVFLNGIKKLDSYIQYSKEYDQEKTLQELVGAGLRHFVQLTDNVKILYSAKGEYELEYERLYRGDGYLKLSAGNFQISFSASRFNVKDGYSGERILVISNFSTGKEDRYSYSILYNFKGFLKVYQSTMRSYVQYPLDNWMKGDVYRAGLFLDYFANKGFLFDINFYYYDGELSDAKGAASKIDWSITNKLKFIFNGEYVKKDNWNDSENLYSLYTKAEYLFKKLTLSIYAEKNKNTIYLPDRRFGISARIIF